MINPLLAVAGTTNSEPGEATHLKVARWLRGICIRIAPLVPSTVRLSFITETAAASAESVGLGVCAVPVEAVVVRVICTLKT